VGSTFLPNQENSNASATLHNFNSCSQYDEAVKEFNFVLAYVQYCSTAIALGLAVACMLTGWISRHDRLRHDVHQAGTITCEMQEFLFSRVVTDPDLFVKARLLPFAGTQKTGHVHVRGEVEAIVPNHERHATLMHFEVEPGTKPVLHLELWNDECPEVDEFGERLLPPKLVGHRLIPIDEVKWFKPTKYWFVPSSQSIENLDEFYRHFEGYHWAWWAHLLVGWAKDGIISLFRKPIRYLKAMRSNLCGTYVGALDQSHVVSVTIVFSIPTGGSFQANDRSASAVEQVAVRHRDMTLAPRSVRESIVV
jgi:hypothetical protein